MSNPYRIAVLALCIGLGASPAAPAAPALALAAPSRIATAAIRAAVNEARLHMAAASWAAAERVLKGLRQQLSLDPTADAVRVKVEFVLWDLRMSNHAAAVRDLEALAKLL